MFKVIGTYGNGNKLFSLSLKQPEVVAEFSTLQQAEDFIRTLTNNGEAPYIIEETEE